MNLFWADKLKYLGLYFDSGKMIKIDILPIMRKLYGSANTGRSRVGRRPTGVAHSKLARVARVVFVLYMDGRAS